MHDIRAFTMGDAGYFLGVVALLNSLRLTGNAMPLTVLDVGLEAWQRAQLEPHCDLVSARSGVSVYHLKAHAPMASDADIVLMLDGDVIVTGSLSPMVDAAAAGKVCAYGDQMAEQRWFPEWTHLLGLRAPLRRGPYVNAGAIAVSTARMPGFLPRWTEVCGRVAGAPTMEHSALGADDPLWLADQDPLNALLLSEVPSDQVVAYGYPGMVIGAENLARAKVVDAQRLRCTWQGEPVTLLHAVGRLKPWHRRASRELRRTAYTTLLRRVLAAPDVELRVPSAHLPRWLRPGPAGATVAWALHAYDVGARGSRPVRQRLHLSSGRPPVPLGAEHAVAAPRG